MKTPEELKAIKEELEAVTKKMSELTEDEMKQVMGGAEGETVRECPFCGEKLTVYEYAVHILKHMYPEK